MIKIDAEKFDRMIEELLTNDEKYLEFKKSCSPIDNENMATFLFSFSEKIYNKGFINGMDFIVNKEKIDLFNSD